MKKQKLIASLLAVMTLCGCSNQPVETIDPAKTPLDEISIPTSGENNEVHITEPIVHSNVRFGVHDRTWAVESETPLPALLDANGIVIRPKMKDGVFNIIMGADKTTDFTVETVTPGLFHAARCHMLVEKDGVCYDAHSSYVRPGKDDSANVLMYQSGFDGNYMPAADGELTVHFITNFTNVRTGDAVKNQVYANKVTYPVRGGELDEGKPLHDTNLSHELAFSDENFELYVECVEKGSSNAKYLCELVNKTDSYVSVRLRGCKYDSQDISVLTSTEGAFYEELAMLAPNTKTRAYIPFTPSYGAAVGNRQVALVVNDIRQPEIDRSITQTGWIELPTKDGGPVTTQTENAPIEEETNNK